MRLFEVGKLFEDGKTKYQEGVKFDFTQSGPVLTMFFDKPTEKEIECVRSGGLQCGFYVKDEIIFMLFKFGGLEWVDAPYSIHLSKPFEFQQIDEGMGFGLNVYFVDAATGILKVMKLFGLHTKFSISLRDEMLAQRQKSFDVGKYQQKINQVYGNYCTKDFVDRATIIKI